MRTHKPFRICTWLSISFFGCVWQHSWKLRLLSHSALIKNHRQQDMSYQHNRQNWVPWCDRCALEMTLFWRKWFEDHTALGMTNRIHRANIKGYLNRCVWGISKLKGAKTEFAVIWKNVRTDVLLQHFFLGKGWEFFSIWGTVKRLRASVAGDGTEETNAPHVFPSATFCLFNPFSPFPVS